MKKINIILEAGSFFNLENSFINFILHYLLRNYCSLNKTNSNLRGFLKNSFACQDVIWYIIPCHLKIKDISIKYFCIRQVFSCSLLINVPSLLLIFFIDMKEKVS